MFKRITNSKLGTRLARLRALPELSGSTRNGFKVGGVAILFLLLTALVGMGLAPQGASASTVILYQNNFENPQITPSLPCATDFYQDDVNSLYGPGWQQVWTPELMRINRPGGYYSDPSGIGGNYALGILSHVQDDRVALTFNRQGHRFINVAIDISPIGANGCGIPLQLGAPTFRMSLFNSPNNVFNINSPGTALSYQDIQGSSPVSRNVYQWTHHVVTLDANAATGNYISVYWDLLSGGYGAFDNLVIAASDNPGQVATDTPVPPTNTPTNTPTATNTPASLTPTPSCPNGAVFSFTGQLINANDASRDLEMADLDGNGTMDLVSPNMYGSTIRVLRGNSNGTFQDGGTFNVGGGAQDVAVADVNGDGWLDVVTANGDSNTVGIVLGNGNGTFQPPTTVGTSFAPRGVAVGDFNGDGRADFATANENGNNASVILSTGPSTYAAAQNYPTGGRPSRVAVGDFNSDGRPDLAVTNSGGIGTLTILLNNGNGTFATAANYPIGAAPYAQNGYTVIAASDLNGDGKLDLVVGNWSSGGVTVFLGNGYGAFQAPVDYLYGLRPGGVALGDMDGNGTLDLVATNANGQGGVVLLGNGNGTFQIPPATGFSNFQWGTGVVVGDFNGDGKLDIANSHEYGSVAVNLNTSTCFNPDTTPPSITGSRNPAPNAAGWNNTNVTVSFVCQDELGGSGMQSCSAPTTLTAEGAGQSVTGTASDVAGNTNSAIVGPINIDKTNPTIGYTLSPAQPDGNNGWYKSNVIVTFTCGDQVGLSGVANCPGQHTFSQSGANQSYTATVFDLAGNSASVTVSGINIDKAAPTLSGAPIATPNAAGWYNGNVAVQWTCADQMGLSGVAGGCPSSSTITGEGTGLTSNASVSDNAGNTTSANSVPAVNIDRSNPVTQASAPSGWQNGSVTVNLSATDNLSNVKYTYYRLDGGAPTIGMAATISNEGVHSLAFWSEDFAGNVEPQNAIQVRVERSAPTISHTQSPAAVNGWNNSPVTVTFLCGGALSGIQSCAGMPGNGAPSVQATVVVSTEGENQLVVNPAARAVSVAGNYADDPATVSIDLTAPSISASRMPAANQYGWNNTVVTVTYVCNDTLSGMQSCTAVQTIGEGTNQTTIGTATDRAGNNASTSISGINVDLTPPTITGAALTAPNANGWYNGPVTIHFTCSDARSGIDPNGGCPADYTFTSNGANQSYTGTATDRAGNTASYTVSGINIDTTAPVITVSGTRAMLWPPNHQYVTLNVSSFVLGGQDNLDPQINASGVTISSVSSDELETTPGSGNTLNDIVIAPDGRSVQLRAEREGGGNGRVYTITVRITDRAGNVGTATYQAHTPPSQGNRNSIDDGPSSGYTVNRP